MNKLKIVIMKFVTKFIKIKPEKLGAAMLGMTLFGILVGWVIFPAVLNAMLKKMMSLKKGTDIRDMWEVLPFALSFKIWLFNYTNPEEVIKGAIPIVKEVGPYYYEEWMEKVNIEEIEEDDAIYYNRRNTFYFNQTLSGPGLTGEEYITMPNPFLLGVSIVVATEKAAVLNMLNKAIPHIFDDQTDIFKKIKAREFIFDGMIINCDKTDFAAKAVCSTLRKEVKSLDDAGDGKLKFSLFGQKNGTIEEPKFKVLRGIKNIMDVGRVIEYNNKPALETWNGPECNEFRGTDGTVFPPHLKSTDLLESFSVDICRSLPATYLNKTSYRGIKTHRYVADLGDLQNEPENHCFCDTPDTCPKKGLQSVYPCIGAPLSISLPHFHKSDPSLLANVKGLNPNEYDHGIFLDFEPISGTPMFGAKRLQFSMQLMKIDKLEWNRELPDTLAPIFWVEEGIALNKTFVNMLKHQLFYPRRLVRVLQWMMIIGGIFGTAFAAFQKYRMSVSNTVTVEPAKEPTESAKETANANGLGNLQKTLNSQDMPTISDEI